MDDPLDGDLHAMDEDSQESLTLKNALEPLSDTQSSRSQDPERSQPASAPPQDGLRLLSRPQDNVVDPAASFTYGKPLKIIPGKFGRVSPTRPINHGPEEVLGSNVHGARNGLDPESPRAVYEQAQPLLTANTRKPLPIEVHLPQNLPANSGDRLQSMFTSSSSRDPPDVRNIRVAHKDGAASPEIETSRPHLSTDYHERVDSRENTQNATSLYFQNHQQSAMIPNAAITQANDQHHRLSLPNDTSVSSPQVPKHAPHVGPSRQVEYANRPMRDVRRTSNVNTPTNRPDSRSSAHGSNISKKRSRHNASSSGKARASRVNSTPDYEKTPSNRRRELPSSMSSNQNSASHGRRSFKPCDLESLAGGVVQSLNGLFVTLKADREQKNSEMALLARHVEKQQSKLSRYKKQAEGGTNAIRQLEESHAQLQEELLAANQQLADRSEKTSKLEGKCRQYREYLNSAIAEQQSLYKAASAKCEDAIKQMREAEQKQKAVSEQERRQADATLDRLKQAVKVTVAECGFKERELNNKVETLNEKLKQQEADLSREQATAQKLSQQEKAITSVHEAVQSIGSQIEQVAIKLTGAASRRVSQDEIAAREIHSKLDNIVDRLSALEKQVVPSTDIVQRLQEVNAETFASILEQVLSTQAEAHADVKKLSDGLENYMEDFWMKLEDREEVLTELLDQVKAENEQLGIHLQLKEEEYSALSDRLSETEATIRNREEELSALKDEIAVVEQAQADGIQEAARANLLHHECEKLKNDLAAKSTLASELQRRLQESEFALTVQDQKHARSTEQMHNLLKQREEEARASQNVAVELARQEAILEMNKAKETLQMLLSQAEGDRATLQADLDTARQKISTMEDEGIRESATVKGLESELQMAQSRAVRLSVEATSKETDHQQMMKQHTMLIRELEAKLANKEKAVSQLSEDVLAYDKQAQKVLHVLKQWTLENEAVRELASQLEMAEHGDLDGIDPSFKPLLEIDMLHKAIFRYCQSQEEAITEAAKTKHGIERRTGEKQKDRAVMQDHPPSSPPEPMPQYAVANKILDQFRRVTIRSPSGIAPSPRPPSVNTEQARRRTGDRPRSIMKLPNNNTLLVEGNDEEEQARPVQDEHYFSRSALTGTKQRQPIAAPHYSQDEEEIRQPGLPSRGGSDRSTQGQPAATAKSRLEEQEVQQEPVGADSVLKHGGYNRGPYNRLVAGTKSRLDGFIAGGRSLKIELSKGSCDQDASTSQAHTPREPQKRKQLFPQESEMSRKRTKPDSNREKSLFSTPCSPPEQSTKQQHMMPVPNAPRKRGHRTAIAGIQPSSPIRGSQTAPDWYASRTSDVVADSTQNAFGQRTSSSTHSMSSQGNSQDNEALYYERRRSIRGNEESQDSIAHSQDMRGGNEMSISHTRRI